MLSMIGWRLEGTGIGLAVSGVLDSVAPHRVETSQVAGATMSRVIPSRQGWSTQIAKSVLERSMALFLIVLVLPVLAVCAVVIKLDSRGGVLFRQQRVGRDGRLFWIYKLRTMRVTAEAEKKELADLNEADGPLFKVRKDPRITRVGAFLRATSLDELPQLFNVLGGSMSLIGPRPSLPDEVAEFDGSAVRRLAVRPGISGLAQVNGRSTLSWDKSVEYDVHYVDNWRLSDDLSIGARTISAVLQRRGAY